MGRTATGCACPHSRGSRAFGPIADGARRTTTRRASLAGEAEGSRRKRSETPAMRSARTRRRVRRGLVAFHRGGDDGAAPPFRRHAAGADERRPAPGTPLLAVCAPQAGCGAPVRSPAASLDTSNTVTLASSSARPVSS